MNGTDNARVTRSPAASSSRGLLVLLPCALALAHCSSTVGTAPSAATVAVQCDAQRGIAASKGRFERVTVEDGGVTGPGWVSLGDLNGDGRTDIVLSSLGPVVQDGSNLRLSPGSVQVYLQGETPSCWQRVEVLGPDAGLYFPNQTTLRDMDGDGDLDVFVPAGFFVCTFDTAVRTCGALSWLENKGVGQPWPRHDVLTLRERAFYHQVGFADLDGDGVDDLVTIAETTSDPRAVWFRGTTEGSRFEAIPRDIGPGGGSLPTLFDVDGDGDMDVLSAQYFAADHSFVWFEQQERPSAAAPAGRWARHALNSDSGKGFHIQVVPDLLGDGKPVAVATNHTNRTSNPDDAESAVLVLAPSGDVRAPWQKTTVSEGIVSRPTVGSRIMGAPGVFGYGDIDGDGDVDLAVAGDGDARTFWMEQTTPGRFVMHTVEEAMGQAAGAKVYDVDGDGRRDLVFVGYEANVLYVYRNIQ